MRLIDADALMRDMGVADAVKYGNETTEQQHNSYSTLMKYEIADCIEDAPTIEAEPVRHGKWVKAHGMMPPEYHHRHICSSCGGWALQDFFGRERFSFYCPHCGAKMDLEG